jgi:hypothetical protein
LIENQPDEAAVAAEIDTANFRYTRASVDARPELAQDDLAADFMIVDPSGIVRGWEQFRSEILALAEQLKVIAFDIKRESIQVVGAEAFVRGRYRYAYQRPGEPVHAYDGDFVQIWVHDGRWRLHRDITVDRNPSDAG